MKKIKKFLSVFIAVCCLMGCLIVPSSAYTIQNNGHDGIYINIESAPYKTLAQVPTWGQYAYGTSGCAWFASARARELTGKNIQTIWSGQSWYNSAYSSYGFSRGSTIKAKSLACYANHVSVIERVNGNNVIISEGGYTEGNASTGYCVIRSTTVSAIQAGNSLTGSFLGYVYLGVDDIVNYTISYNANGGTGAPASQTKTHGTTLTLSSTAPTRTGYTFLGWSTNSNATTATYSAGGSFTTDTNTTLYAVWKVNEVTGTCGENLTWKFDGSTATLTISGTGEMDNYFSTTPPWDSYKDSIKKVVIDDGVTSIGDEAFFGCDSLTSVTIGDSVTTIGGYAFADCTSLASVTIPDSVTTISGFAFCWCDSLTSVTIGDSVTTIGGYAFACDSLVSINVSDDNTAYSSTDGVLFNKNKTILIRYPAGNTRTTYSIPDSVKTIQNQAFANCTSLASVTIPDSVTTIGDWAFDYCNALICVTIGDGVKTIGYSAFGYCNSLTDVYYSGTEVEWNNIIIEQANENLTSATIHYDYIKPHIHDYSSVITSPTCTDGGYTTYVCNCGNSYTDNYTNAVGHKYKSVITEPTCTDAGYTTYTCVCGDTFTSNTVSPTGHNYENGICINCGRADTITPSEPENPDTSYAFSIKEPSTTTIRHNDSIILHINVDGELPEGSSIEWSVNNDNFDGGYTEDGMQCLITSKNNGYTTVVATLYDANDNVLATDSIEMRSKAGFFDKIGGFFRSLFGTTKIYEY